MTAAVIDPTLTTIALKLFVYIVTSGSDMEPMVEVGDFLLVAANYLDGYSFEDMTIGDIIVTDQIDANDAYGNQQYIRGVVEVKQEMASDGVTGRTVLITEPINGNTSASNADIDKVYGHEFVGQVVDVQAQEPSTDMTTERREGGESTSAVENQQQDLVNNNTPITTSAGLYR
jgi:hypothetical protein